MTTLRARYVHLIDDMDVAALERSFTELIRRLRLRRIGRAHGEFFRNVKPAATMVEVKSLISPDYLIEIEASAIRSV